MHKFVERGALAVAFVSALIVPLCLMGCSADKSGKAAEVAASLSATASKNGVSFLIDPSWKNSLDSNYGGVEPCSANKITVDTFADGRGDTLESVEDAGLLGSPDGYEQDGSFDIAGGTTVKYYTSESDGNLYSVAIGHNGASGAGFMVFFNRGSRANPGVLDDDTYEKIVRSIRFDADGAQLAAKGSSSSSSGSSAKTESGQSDESSNKQEPDVPSSGQVNALNTARSYLSFSHFSYQGLIEQLEYEKFSHEDAVYGADNCGADWNVQAAGKAADYLEFKSFSRDGLIAQLEYEGFTAEQSEYGASAVGL